MVSTRSATRPATRSRTAKQHPIDLGSVPKKRRATAGRSKMVKQAVKPSASSARVQTLLQTTLTSRATRASIARGSKSEQVSNPASSSSSSSSEVDLPLNLRRSSRRTSIATPTKTLSKKRKADESPSDIGLTRASKRTRMHSSMEAAEAHHVVEEEAERVESSQTRVERLKRDLDEKKRQFQAMEASYAKLDDKVKALTAERDNYAKMVEECDAKLAETYAIAATPGPNLQWVLGHLEDQYSCSLCFEIMANPYCLSNGGCGHTFCAMCILKWAFAPLHYYCGGWHNALECPLCRAKLLIRLEAPPRSDFTFPFVPARLADSSIKSFLQILKDAADANVDHDGQPSACAGGDGDARWCGIIDEKVMEWGTGKNARLEWETRDRMGRTEMSAFLREWPNLGADDLRAIKNRLRTI